MSHWSAPFVAFLRRIIPELAVVPLYLLKASEAATDLKPHWLGMFSQLADLQAQSTLESLELWRGRGCCVLVRDDFETWSTRPRMGTLLHEAAHALEYLIQPDALATELTPIAREWLESGESKMLTDAGIDRNDLIRSQHGENFVRYAAHLHVRARAEMHIVASDLQFLHPIYSLSPDRYEDVVEALRHELAMTRNLNLLRLRESPVAFTALFSS